MVRVSREKIPRGLREWEYWDPFTRISDAIELAEKADIPFAYIPLTKLYWAGKGENYKPSPDLCAAICAAVDAVLEGK